MTAPRHAGRGVAIGAGSLAVLLGALDTYVVVTIMRDIISTIGIPVNHLQRITPIITWYLLGYIAAMPLLGRAKRKIARELRSGALHADSRQADFCAYLSAILLVGLVLHWLLGWWWSDAVAALIMVPIFAREGVEGLRGKACEDCS